MLLVITTAQLRGLVGLLSLLLPLLLLLSLPLLPPPFPSRRRRRCRLLWLPLPSSPMGRLSPMLPPRTLLGLQVETPALEGDEEEREGTP